MSLRINISEILEWRLLVSCFGIREGRGFGRSLCWQNHQEPNPEVALARMLDSFDDGFF